MNEYDLSDAATGTVQKPSSTMALSVSDEMTQRTGEQMHTFCIEKEASNAQTIQAAYRLTVGLTVDYNY